ncbi:hypothetical protein [Neobacillus sp. 114]|uniref:multiheme c-type cytochrome n=1 Tax=Neobacillus sp. 114 TaxID=3048535 RepID=UPI0024C2C921|nr:hypothetical protein [Neobacillus sp. 114]
MYNKSYIYIFLIVLLLGTTILSFPSIDAYSASDPAITIESPVPNEELSTKNVVISGSYTSEFPKSELSFTASEDGVEIADSNWQIDETSHKWTFSTSALSEGDHAITIKLEELSSSSTSNPATASIAFIIKIPTVTVKPAISITTPSPSEVFDSTNILILGTYTADVPQTNLMFTLLENGKKISDSSANAGDWNFDETSSPKKWSFSTKTLPEGTHTVSMEMTDKVTGEIASATTSFILALTRPYIGDTKIIFPDNSEKKSEDLTSVPLNAKIKITVVDDQRMDQLKSKIDTGSYNPINVILGTDTIKGTTQIGEPVLKNNKYYYDITFTPAAGELKINRTYLVYLDPELADDLDNPVFTKFFKITTKTNADWDDIDEQKHTSSNPHEHYMLNTNMCASCHSTHTDSPFDKLDTKSKLTSGREGGSYLIDFNEQLNGKDSQNYCMACHDGTTNAPLIDGITSQYHHDNPVEYSSTGKDNLKDATSCTSCHNPHAEWSEENPNLLKDHYVYKHNSEDQEKMGATPLTVDSLDTSCETCHDNTIEFAAIPADKGMYELLKYNKSFTAVGNETTKINKSTDLEVPTKTIGDYSLCLRCHNLEKKKQNKVSSDIESFYLDANSGHNFSIPMNATTQRDGSQLNGPIPCAECHETHGSNNLYNLREVLGNNPTVTDKYRTSGTKWNAVNEREFCTKCHNGSTEIYGIKGNAIYDDAGQAINSIVGHNKNDIDQACSKCHSTNNSFIEAAHAPKK